MGSKSSYPQTNGEEGLQQNERHATPENFRRSPVGHNADSFAGYRVFHSKDGRQLTYPVAERARVEARICAGILGSGPLTLGMMATEEWAKNIYSLPFRGVSRAGLAEYLAKVSAGAFTDPLFPAGNHATNKAFSKTFQIPNLFRDTAALARRLPELQKYAKDISPNELKDPEILADIQRELLGNKMKYFGTESVEVVMDGPLAKPRVSENVRLAFGRLPKESKHQKCLVMREGSNLIKWTVAVEGTEAYSGTARTKTEARMLALVKYYYDANFDGSSPLADDATLRSRPVGSL